MEIGEKLRNLRIQKNLTQEELGERTDLSKGYISQLERDLSSPSIAHPKEFDTRRTRRTHRFVKRVYFPVGTRFKFTINGNILFYS